MDCNIETFFCNQKHLILNDRVYIENELAKETTLQLSFAKTLLRFLKKFVPTEYPIGIIKVLSITQRTFAFIAIIARKRMPVERSYSVA